MLYAAIIVPVLKDSFTNKKNCVREREQAYYDDLKKRAILEDNETIFEEKIVAKEKNICSLNLTRSHQFCDVIFVLLG